MANTILDMIKSNDPLIRYECLMCLGKLIENDSELSLNYSQLINVSTPILLYLLDTINNPKLIFSINLYLGALLEKSFETNNHFILQQFKNINIEKILNKNPVALIPALGEVLKKFLIYANQLQDNYFTRLFCEYLQYSYNHIFDDIVLNTVECTGLFLRQVDEQ